MDTAHRLTRLILRLAAIATFVLGIITLLAPDFVVAVANGYSNGNYHLVRFIGTALIGFGITNWFYSKFDDLKATLPAIYGNLASLLLAIAVDVLGLVTNMLNASAWLILGMHVVFFILFIKCVLLIRYSSGPKRQ